MAPNLISPRKVAAIIIAIGLAVVVFGLLLAMVDSYIFDTSLGPHPPPRAATVIEEVYWNNSTSQIRFLVKNTGGENVTLNEVYVDGTLDPEAAVIPQVLSPNQTAEIVLSKKYAKQPTVIVIRLMTSDNLPTFASKLFFGVQMEQIEWDENTGHIKFLVKNTGEETVTLSEVYANGMRDVTALANPIILPKNQTTEIKLSGTFRDVHTPIAIKVSTLEGASDERSQPIYGIWIGSVGWDNKTGRVSALVNSNGYEDVTFSGVYINGTLDSAATFTGSPHVYTVTLSKTYLDGPMQFLLKVTTADGAWYEMAYPNIRIRIEEINWDNSMGQIKVLVQDMSANGVTFNNVYVNGTLDEAATILRAPPIARMYQVTLSETYPTRPSEVTIKITTVEGSFDEKLKNFTD